VQSALRIATWIATWYPGLALASIYSNWIVTWVELERCPRSSLDDPKHVGTLGPIVHWFSVWGLVLGFYAFCAAALFLLIALLLPQQPERRRLALRVAISALGSAAVYGWFRADPGNVIEWYFD
jgi:hypothetical protein